MTSAALGIWPSAVAGEARWSSSSPVSATPLALATSGVSPTSATRTAEVMSNYPSIAVLVPKLYPFHFLSLLSLLACFLSFFLSSYVFFFLPFLPSFFFSFALFSFCLSILSFFPSFFSLVLSICLSVIHCFLFSFGLNCSFGWGVNV